MSFSKMKPLPKFLILGSIIAAVGYGINAYIQSRPASPVAEAIKVETTTVPAEGTPAAASALQNANSAVKAATQAAEQAAPTPAPTAPAGPAPGLTPAAGHDAGLANVLKK